MPSLYGQKNVKNFSNIKNILCSQPVLEIFDKDLPITIYTDASLNGIGAILKQIQKNGKEKPVGYFSKKLNDTQKRKKAIYLECLAIKEAIKYWQYWLIGRKFTVFSDQKPLENLNIKARTDDELGELTFYLSQYDFNIKYIPGKNNTEADSLSRNPVLEDNNNDEEILKTVNLITIDDIKADQQKNEKIKEKKTKIIERNGILYKKDRNREKLYYLKKQV
ncbi:Retrovirus-related Pol polyprotein from transposon 297 [Eumeta japonica]|uniref:Retrovirus-related Pol polyprotein from transposon 297 n=1 Tax=Eumeta variegata TaxID=151549 RepID=A0A4C1WNT7_EUMVA|nr:Retrovirus-related Pol polyprotein from transposon 297 [Eumeta japonica]